MSYAMADRLGHLVIVCGHGTYKGEGDVWQESSWVLEPFRRSDTSTNKPSEHYTFLQHILCGATILEQDPTALLVFSGGQTQDEVNLTESQSYINAYAQLRGTAHLDRVTGEDFATDSYQNLLFSVLAFHKSRGHYPEHITIITHAFKERRFLESHASAIHWPADKIRTIGINPAFTLAELERVQWGENESAYKHFINDPHGTRSPLSDKRKKRGWDESCLHNYIEGVEESVRSLVLWNGSQPWTGSLPWHP